MRTALLLAGLCLLLTALSPTASADSVTVSGEAAGVPFSVGPATVPGPNASPCTVGFEYQTQDLGPAESHGRGRDGACGFYVRVL